MMKCPLTCTCTYVYRYSYVTLKIYYSQIITNPVYAARPAAPVVTLQFSCLCVCVSCPTAHVFYCIVAVVTVYAEHTRA